MNEEQLKQFTMVSSFGGYKAKRDVVKEDAGIAVSGSQNIITIDGEKIGNRPGFSYLGTRSTDRYGILGGGNWKTSTGTELPWRSFLSSTTNGTIEVWDGTAWRTLGSGYSTGKFRTTTWWSSTEVQDLLIMVEGTDIIYMWSGGKTTFASATVNTLTKQGTTTWAEDRFLASSTRGVRVLDDTGTWREGTYTGGEGTTTLTGVSVDFTSYAISVGNPILQTLRVSTNKPAAGLDNDFVSTYLNYVFYFDEQNRNVYMSKNTDYTDFTSPASPRVPGEAGTFTLDQPPTASITQPDGNTLYVSTRDQWYQFKFTPSADLTKEVIDILPFKTSPLEGATNSLAVTGAKNNIVLISGEPTIDSLGNVENFSTPQTVPLSDPIKNYMDSSGTSTSTIGYYKNNFYCGLKESASNGANNRLLVRNLALGAWETPWTIPSSVIFEYAGYLYAHDPATTNTYKLLDGYSDGATSSTSGAPIVSKWFSSHENYGLPFNQKKFNMMWIDGYIRANTTLEIYISYDFGSEIKSFTLEGTQDDVVLSSVGGGLGFYSLGTRNLGGRAETLAASGLKRFRGFITIPERPFYELQTSFQSNGVDYRWELVEYGFNITKITGTNNNLKIT